MLNVYRSNRQEKIADALAKVLESPPGQSLGDRDWIAVQSQPMESWVKREMGMRLGIFAGAKFSFPRELIEYLLRLAETNRDCDFEAFSEERLTWSILSTLKTHIKEPAFKKIKQYLEGDEGGTKELGLAKQIARIFDEYAVYRPEMLLDWEEKRPNEWQSVLWNDISNKAKAAHIAKGAARFFEAVKLSSIDLPTRLPRISLFGISTLPPIFLKVLLAAGSLTEVNLFVHSPSGEYWAYMQSKNCKEEYLHIENGNVLLASSGRVYRDFQAILEEAGDYHEPDENLYEDPLLEENPTILKTLQSDILHLVDRASKEQSPLTTDVNDRSVQIHSCHSPMREAEVLHDVLLDLFDDSDLDLAANNVLVIVPDLKTYAPLIHAVFDAGLHGTRTIPYRIIDSTQAVDAPPIAAFFSVIDLASSRLSIQEVLDVLRMESVRLRFGLTANDVELAEDWAHQSGIRWGIDGAHRILHGQPAYEENTWRFGLKRLFLGYAMPGKGETMFAGVLPYDEIEGLSATALGGFASFCRHLFEWIESAGKPRTVREWSKTFGEIFAQFITDKSDSHARSLLWTALGNLDRTAEISGFRGEITLAAVQSILFDSLNSLKMIGSQASLGVTFCGTLSMREIPFKAICLMGMGLQVFPRAGHSPSFDLMALNPRLGDRSFRTDDRHTFLSALLSARDRFIITYVGQNIRDNSRIPPSILVDELIGVAKKSGFANDLVIEHPLHSFSVRYFEGNNRLFSYFDRHCDIAKASLQGPASPAPFFSKPLPGKDVQKISLSLNELIDFYKLPVRHFFCQKLGIGKAAGKEYTHVDREPMESNPLERYIMGSSLTNQALKVKDLTELYPIYRASGNLPLGAMGLVRFEELAQEAETLIQAVARETAGFEPLTREVSIELNANEQSVIIEGKLDSVFKKSRIETRFGVITAKVLLEVWIKHLALCCAFDEDGISSKIYGFNDSRRVCITALRRVEKPHEVLTDLVKLYIEGQNEPLRLFPEISMTFAEDVLKDKADALDIAGLAFENHYFKDDFEKHYYEGDKTVVRVFEGRDALKDNDIPSGLTFSRLSLDVFTPIIKHIESPTLNSFN